MLQTRQVSKSLCRKLTELNFIAKMAMEDASIGRCEESPDELEVAAQRALSLYNYIVTIQKYKESL